MGVRVLIAGAAPEPLAESFYRALLADFDVVIAADAAAEWCVWLGRTPDLAVGDFDSADPGAVGRLTALGVAVESFSAEKDESDLDLCVAAARRLGYQKAVFTAAFSARLDHTLAAVGTVIRATDLAPVILDAGLTGVVVDAEYRPSVSLDVPLGVTFSILSPAGATEVTVSGGRYTLAKGDLGPLSSLGLSNVVADGPLRVSVREGGVLVLVNGSVGVPDWAGGV